MRLCLLLCLMLVGCASATHQTDAFLKKAHQLPESHVIEDVPFIEQSAGHCGPATLTMAMQWAGKDVTVDELVKQVYTPGAEGSFQLDMMSATRRQGMLAIPVSGLEDLLAEVAAGHPVIVFENLSVSWLPQWHYAVVFGYHLPSETVVMHSGPEDTKHWDMRKFERSWKLGDYWGMVVLPPDQLSATADEMTHVKAAAALEQVGRLSEAESAYLKILERWPNSLAANMGAANVAFKSKNHQSALDFLQKATEAHPNSAMAWHNLTIAYGASERVAEARQSAVQAVKLAPKEAKPAYRKRLKKWLTDVSP